MQKACIRFLSMIALVILVMSAVGIDSAYADSVDEWNRACRKKTKGSTPVYAPNDFDFSGPPVLTLPSGTYVKIIGGGSDYKAIEYMTSGGVKGTGYVPSNNIVSACVFGRMRTE